MAGRGLWSCLINRQLRGFDIYLIFCCELLKDPELLKDAESAEETRRSQRRRGERGGDE